jgi:hypothetical protein
MTRFLSPSIGWRPSDRVVSIVDAVDDRVRRAP